MLTVSTRSPTAKPPTNPADRFSKLIVNGVAEEKEWTSVRQTKNYQGNQGVTDVNSPDMRCFQNRPGTATATAAAGDRLGFVAMSAVTHFGPVSFYMARVPEGQNINTWEAAGNVWFKVGEISAVPSNGGGLTSGEATWPAYSRTSVIFQPFFFSFFLFSFTQTNLLKRQKNRRVHRPQERPQRQVPRPRREYRAAPGAECRWCADLSLVCPG